MCVWMHAAARPIFNKLALGEFEIERTKGGSQTQLLTSVLWKSSVPVYIFPESWKFDPISKDSWSLKIPPKMWPRGPRDLTYGNARRVTCVGLWTPRSLGIVVNEHGFRRQHDMQMLMQTSWPYSVSAITNKYLQMTMKWTRTRGKKNIKEEKKHLR